VFVFFERINKHNIEDDHCLITGIICGCSLNSEMQVFEFHIAGLEKVNYMRPAETPVAETKRVEIKKKVRQTPSNIKIIPPSLSAP